MLKKIATSSLKPGMYVANITQHGLSLHEHEREGRIKDQTTIQSLIKRGIKELYIDTDLGVDSPDAITLEASEKKLDTKIKDIAQTSEPERDVKSTSLSKELGKATKLHSEALDLVNNAMSSVKSGQSVDISPFEDMADNFMDSVVRNQNALACLSRIRKKDDYLMEHSVNVAVLMSILGKYLKLERAYLHQCVTGALLHDIGKILIPDRVLHKPDKLTEEEYDIMKRHATYSQKILQRNARFSQVSINVAAQHHERLDGKGYPLGLKGDEISKEARMASVADIYDAITADRVYHKGMTPSNALKRMMEWCGPHLDTHYVHSFIKAIGVYPVGSFVKLSNDKGAVVIEKNPDTLKPHVKVIYDFKTQSHTHVSVLNLSLEHCQERITQVLDPNDYGIKLKDFML
ncbi:MAG: phosphohydrolase [Bermanella sp.]|nr:phosphohydrolase [Bermanella sp.]|tara:strand:+ start:1824 stop:3035 length:1212 start_codon:yes stop_codon:yes gene_type:complete